MSILRLQSGNLYPAAKRLSSFSDFREQPIRHSTKPLLALLLFFADDPGYADIGVNGCKDIPTPHIDSIAKNGVRYTDGYAKHPVCSPSRAGLMSGKELTDADLTALASMIQLESLSLESLDLPVEHLPHLQAFAHLKSLTLIRYGKGYPDETQAKVKALLPKVEVKWVK
jgi:hypothetical protein